MILVIGILLTLIFSGIGVLIAVVVRDKAKGIGRCLLHWLYFALIFDGVVLFLSFQYADYPLEKPMIVASALNPIDLARILILLKMDVSALMGYTGAVFTEYFGTLRGMLISFTILILWLLIPYFISERRFIKGDL